MFGTLTVVGSYYGAIAVLSDGPVSGSLVISQAVAAPRFNSFFPALRARGGPATDRPYHHWLDCVGRWPYL